MDNNLKNLINLSSQYDIKLFNKKKMSIKSKDILVKEFEKRKNKEVKNSSYILSNLSKISNNNIEDVKCVYKDFEYNETNRRTLRHACANGKKSIIYPISLYEWSKCDEFIGSWENK